MKPSQSTRPDKGTPRGRTPDRLARLLLGVAFVLIAALAAVIADSIMYPRAGDSLAQALEATPLPAQSWPAPPSAVPAALALLPSPSISPAVPAPPTAEPPTPIPVTPPACVPPDDWGIHLVTQGNTLYSLARRYGTDVDTLMFVNCLSTHTIFTGQRLYVPGSPTPPAVVALASPGPVGPVPTRLPGSWATPVGEELGSDALSIPSAPDFRGNIPNIYLNILLLGSDKRPDSGAWRTDSMIVVSVDERNKVVRLLSIPRDLWVDIPGHGYNRINTADLWGELAQKGGGPQRVKETIYQNLGIPIHYYIRVDFQGFIKIVDLVGGVDVDVECALSDINLSAGMHHFDGKHALQYARSRKSTNDFDRGRRQRKVLMALWEQALTLDIVPRLPELWITMADSFKTDLPLSEVINLAYLGTQIKHQHIRTRAIDASMTQSWVTPAGAFVQLPRAERIQAMLESFYAPVPAADLDAGEKVRVQVLNGAARKDGEQLAAAALRWAGYKVVEAGTAPRRDYARTSIIVANGDLAAGQAIATLLGVSTSLVTQQALPGATADVQVILGADYNPCR